MNVKGQLSDPLISHPGSLYAIKLPDRKMTRMPGSTSLGQVPGAC